MVIYNKNGNLYKQKYTSKSKLEKNELKGEFWKLNPGSFRNIF